MGHNILYDIQYTRTRVCTVLDLTIYCVGSDKTPSVYRYKLKLKYFDEKNECR